MTQGGGTADGGAGAGRRVAVLGLGRMGAGMARRLLAHGFAVAAWNRDAAKAAPLGEAGARVAATPAEAATGADAVVSMVADDAASRAVWLGGAGALAALAPGAVAVECSTLTVEWVRELAAAAAARGCGFVDAPVTGSRAQAEGGTLRFLAGGGPDALEAAAPLFAAMGGETVRLGPVGSGALVKLVNNYLCGVQTASLAEALAMVERNGLDLSATADVLMAGAPASPMAKGQAHKMLHGFDAPDFGTALMAKDLRYAGQALAAAGIRSALAAAAEARFAAAAARDPADDISTVLDAVRGEAAG